MPAETADPTLVPDLAEGDKARPPNLSAREIVASLRAEGPLTRDVFDAFWELDMLPIEEVRDALTPWVGPDPDRHRLDAATCVALGIPARPLRLRTLSVTTDADVLDLGPVAEEQLRLAGMSWDGVDRPPEERLDGELEGSFAGTLEHRVLGDADAPDEPPLYDVLLFADDAGIVFAAGTAKTIALIAYRSVEMRDRRARLALEQAIAAPTNSATAQPVDEPNAVVAPPEAPEEPGAAPPAAAEKRARRREKSTARAPAGTKAKKAVAKRSAAKAPPVKKTARKTAKKKAPATKNAAKKTPATTATGKKSAKTAPGKKKAARKSAAKRSRRSG